MDVYENLRKGCAKKGTNITNALKEINRATGAVGGWKSGASPKLEIIMELAQHLNMSIDELVYAEESTARILTPDEIDWLDIIQRLPDAQRDSFREILRAATAQVS